MRLAKEESFYGSFSVFPEIVVVGSANVDLVTTAPRFPLPGETLQGKDFRVSFGGKGLNQAVQAALVYPKENSIRQRSVAFICKIGNDENGREIKKFLEDRHIRSSKVLVHGEDISTGVASIIVTEKGENSIVIIAGANGKFLPEDLHLHKVKQVIQNAKAVLCQNEIPVETTLETFRIAKGKDAQSNEGNSEEQTKTKTDPQQHNHHLPITVFTPSPTSVSLPKELYELTDLICLNETEVSLLFDKSDNADFLNNLPCPLAEKHVKMITDWVYRLSEKWPKCSSECIQEETEEKPPPQFKYVVTLGKYGCCVLDRGAASEGEGGAGEGGGGEEGGKNDEKKKGSNVKVNYVEGVRLPEEKVIDTVGAGDAHTGALAVFLTKGLSLKESARRANSIAAMTIKKEGAAVSFVDHKHLPKDVFDGIVFN